MSIGCRILSYKSPLAVLRARQSSNSIQKNVSPRLLSKERLNFLQGVPFFAENKKQTHFCYKPLQHIGSSNLLGYKTYLTVKRYFCTSNHKNIYEPSKTAAKQEKDFSMEIEVELEKLKRNLEVLVPVDGLAEKLKWSYQKKVPLRVKLGFDPTAPDLHLGHAVVLKKMRQFQDLGHKIIIIIGDFTACIGDPTGRNKTRPPLTQEEIKANATTYLNQLSKILDLSKTEVHFNSEWFDKLSLRDTIGFISKVTLSQILQREDFTNRYKNNIPIHFHELIYPIIQGYDSLMINADIEMGGTDQLFNCLVGRDIQGSYQKNQQIVACVPILRGTDGRKKMSKSLKNYIGLTEEPRNIYGKVMSIPDELIEEYARLLSTFSSEKVQDLCKALSDKSANPMDIKKDLAYDIVKQFHGNEEADKSAEHFYRQVQSRNEELIEFKPVNLQQLCLNLEGLTLLTLCSTLLLGKSKSDIRRIIQGGGVTINSQKITDPYLNIEKVTKEDFKLKIGKRDFYQVALKEDLKQD